MQTLTGTVGEAGANARHDVALVQAVLALSRRPLSLDAGRARYLSLIDGDCGSGTRAALRRFQSDQVFVSAAGTASQAVAGATAGLVSPGDTTFLKLQAALPADLSDLRALSGAKTVYVAATAARLNACTDRVAQLTFNEAFRMRVAALIRSIHALHGIAVGVCRDGDRRTFQTQYGLLTSGRNVTHAGPGESNHNFGQAVDLGFERLRWLQPDGSVVENEDAWLHRLDPKQVVSGEALRFWELLRNAGVQGGLFRGPLGDRPHLQAWSDAGIDMAARLADLLTRAGRMRWAGRGQRYQCDFGLGGRLFEVGRSEQIWASQAPVTLLTLVQARAQAVPRAGAAAPAAPTPQDLAALQAALRADFVAADVSWQDWRAR